ncbi:MAG: hypothetical protein AAF567_06985 [Actinomycetota bacterium]
MRRLLAIALTLAVTCTACGSDAAEIVDRDRPDSTTITAPSSLAFLGDLIVPVSSPVVAVIDSRGGSLALPDGSSVEVPAGAFEQPIELSAHVAEIDFESIFGERTFGQAYVVSTSRDVTPAIPVWIEVPRSAGSLLAVHVVGGGEIAPVAVLGDETARVEIPHFSEQGFLIFEAFGQDQTALRDNARAQAERIREEQRSADATFLTGCIAAVVAIFGAQVGSQGGYDADLTVNVATSVCTIALVRRTAPAGVNVSTDCVGEGVEFGLDFREAIDACAQEAQGQNTEVPEATPGDDTTDSDRTSPAASAQVVWTGTFEIARDDFEGATAREPGQVTVTRIEGTDQFRLETRIVIDWAGECNATDVHTYEGVGDLYADQIYFNGVNTYSPSSDCNELFGSEQEIPRAVYFDEQGLIGTAGTFGDFVLPGEIPQPIDG